MDDYLIIASISCIASLWVTLFVSLDSYRESMERKEREAKGIL